MEESPEKTKSKGIGAVAGIGNILKKAVSSIRSFLMVILVVLLIAINCIFAYWIYMMASNFQAQLTNIADAQAKIQKQAVEQAKVSAGNPAQSSAENPALKEPGTSSGIPSDVIKAGQGIQYDVGPKIINLADPGGRRYIKINIILEYAPNDITYFLEKEAAKNAEGAAAGGEAAKKEGAAATALSYVDKFKAELELQRPLLDDTIITLISSKTFENIYTATGKEQLKKEIMVLLNSRMPEYKVIYVYFSEFTVQ